MRKILITGSSGFLGNVITRNLSGFQVITLSRTASDIIVDLSQEIPTLNQISMVVHAAGKAHLVPTLAYETKGFYDINVNGANNLLKGLERSSTLPNSFIYISTVAVYGLEIGSMIGEDMPLLAADPYGESKVQAEYLIRQWCYENNVTCTILRLPLLAGSKPPGNLASMIKGIKSGYYFNIDGGKASKSMVLAEDVAKIIPIVADIGGIYNLTDRFHPTFSDLSALIAKQLGKSKPLNIPYWTANLLAKAGDLMGSKALITSKKLHKLTSDLTFDDSKAVRTLGWNPTPVLSGFKII